VENENVSNQNNLKESNYQMQNSREGFITNTNNVNNNASTPSKSDSNDVKEMREHIEKLSKRFK